MMKRILSCFGLMFCAIVLMGADANTATKVQSDVAAMLQEKIGVKLEPGKPGKDQHFKVTEGVIKKLEKLQEEGKPIETPAGTENSETMQSALDAVHLKQQEKKDTGGTFKFDVTPETIKALKGKTIVVDGDGKVTLK